MSNNLGNGVSFSYDAEGYNFDKVVFQKGLPPLDGELNLAQELQEIQTRKSTSHLPSGWVSFREYFTSNSDELQNAFYTQDPDGAIPEVALVNGWPVVVAGTNTGLKHVNKVLLTEFPLLSGSRVDGVFLEVWRSLVGPGTDGGSKPVNQSIINDINGVHMHSSNIGWAVGNNGVILKTDNGGFTWKSKNSPSGLNLTKVLFINESIGFIVGDQGLVLKTTDGGELWRRVSTKTVDNLSGISAFDENKLWISGGNGTLLKTINGEDFDIVLNTQQVSSNLNSVFFYDNLIGWAIGDNGVLVKTNNGGVSWALLPITGVIGKLNSVFFVNLNDGLIVGDAGLILKTTDGGNTWANISGYIFNEGLDQYESTSVNLKKVFSIREFPLKVTLSLYNTAVFKSAEYEITPSTLNLSWVNRSTNQEYSTSLVLSSYATAEDLVTAINALTTSSIRVFNATLSFIEDSFTSHSGTGSILESGSTEIKFSIEDRSWIVGDNGMVLTTSNSGAQWLIKDAGTESNLKDVFYSDNNTGWVVGSEGSILKDIGLSFEEQDTDLSSRVIGKIYPEGNVNSLSSNYLNDNILHPDVNVETSKRVQTQYRVRVVEGVDPSVFQESGLGAGYVFSRGPNSTVIEAGSYVYTNMGEDLGDYGLWRANCRNTVDGSSYAIPMFFVVRRNLAPFNSQSNINGSVNFDLSAIRPDEQSYLNIDIEDVIDVRRAVLVRSSKELLEQNFDKLLNNKLRSKIGRRSDKGSQYGTALLVGDRYNGVDELTALVNGNVNSKAVPSSITLGGPTGLDASLGMPSQADLTFPTLSEAIYYGNPAHFSAVYSGITDFEGQPIPGTFSGLGTTEVKFVLGSDAVNGSDFPGLRYLITSGYLDFSAKGLSRVPDSPTAVRNFDTANPGNTIYYRAIDKFMNSKVLEIFDSGIDGVSNFVTMYSANDADVNQMSTGSLIEYHYFKLVGTDTSEVTVPKEIDQFLVYGVRRVVNSNGSLHKIDHVRDRDFVNFTSDKTNLTITIDDAFRIPGGTIVEIVLEVVSVPDTTTLNKPDTERLGITSSDVGETLDAFRNSFVANFDSSAKGVDGFYRSILIPVGSISTPSSITLTGPDSSLIMGIASVSNLDGSKTPYCWYSPSDEVSDMDNNINSIFYFKTVPINGATGFGSNSVTINISPSLTPNAVLYVPALIKEVQFSNRNSTSAAEVFYKFRPYQTVENLPSSLKLEIINVSEYVYISNLGTGGGEQGFPYRNPLDHLPVNSSSFFTENLFFNLDPLRFSNFEISSGFLKMPVIVGRYLGEEITLLNPQSDKLGRSFYSSMSESVRYVCESLRTLSSVESGSPRKVFIPMVGKVKSSITTPFVRGEFVLIVFSRALEEDTNNETGIFDGSETAIGVYRLFNKPIARS